MSRVEELVERIRHLSEEELADFRRRYAELEADLWDLEMEADIEAGRFDALIEEALRDEAAGRCIDL